jgi:hypothetical protein
MNRLTRVTALVCILLALTTASAVAASLSGTYVTTVKSAGSLNGTYHITFQPGKFILRAPYGITGHGTYSISGSKITLHGPGSCGSAGTYTFSVSGSSLTFKKIHDSCPRASVLTAHALKRT